MKRLEVDLEALEDAKYGIKVVAFTDNPAIIIKGVALSKQKEKKVMFADDKKMQIIAPMLIPMDVHRYDDEDGEFELVFTAEAVEKITKQMMKNLPKSGLDSIFTNEHTTDFLDAYIFEVIFVDTKEKQTMLRNQYQLEIPIGGTCLNVQCSNKKTYDYIVKNGKIGLSIDGLFKLKELKLNKVKMSKKTKIKLSKKLRFREGYFKFKSKHKLVALEAEELTVGEEITAYDEDGNEIEDWDGVISVLVDGEETVVTVADGEITEVEVEEEGIEEEEIEAEEEEEEEETKLEESGLTEAQITEAVANGISEALEPILKKLIAIEGIVSEQIIGGEEEEESVEMTRSERHKLAIKKLLAKK